MGENEVAVFFVLKGLHNGEEGVWAKTCLGEQLEDGWYILLEGEDDPTDLTPFESKSEADREADRLREKRKECPITLADIFRAKFREMNDKELESYAGIQYQGFIAYIDGCDVVLDYSPIESTVQIHRTNPTTNIYDCWQFIVPTDFEKIN